MTMRKGEILNLKWPQLQNGMIYLKKTKTDNPREIPVNDTLQGVFNRLKRDFHLSDARKMDAKSDYVFKYKGSKIKYLRTAFNTALVKAEIENFRFHDLRHTFASQLILKGGDLKDVQELLGHKSMTMTLRYAHLTQEHKRNAVNLLNDLPGKKTDSTCHKMSQNADLRQVAAAN